MATAEHRSKVEGYIAKGKAEATLVAGGGRPLSLIHISEPTRPY